MTLSMAAVGTKARVFWTPKDLGASLTAWYDANDSSTITVSGTAVSQWNDKSTNAYNLTQATGANQPSYANTRVTFDGGDWLDASVSMSAISRCAGVVARYTAATGSELLLGTQTKFAGGWALGRDDGSAAPKRLGIFKSGTGYITSSSGNLKLGQDVDAVIVGNTTSTTWRLSKDGTAESGSHSSTLSASQVLRVAAEGNNKPLTGSIREIVIASELSVANQQRLEGYLAWKWGLQGNLPSNHPYKAATP